MPTRIQRNSYKTMFRLVATVFRNLAFSLSLGVKVSATIHSHRL